MTTRNKKRGAHTRSNCTFVGAWIPNDWLDPLDRAVARQDSDRSKLIRKALEEKIRAIGAI